MSIIWECSEKNFVKTFFEKEVGEFLIGGQTVQQWQDILETSMQETLLIRYPWDLLKIAELALGSLKESKIEGDVDQNVTIDGFCYIGEGSRILPGVYIEGNVVIGRNCKISPISL